MYFLKHLLNIFCQHEGVVHGRPSIILLCYIAKSRFDVEFIKKTLLEMAIGRQIKEEGYYQN